ncbi:hypothetical protein HIM_04232 [Hirsutella minnesotensis 3608]|uniref:Mid2 domain-containing protein n=1 Tax=Hirsutella minnesotensis 3608 TaxID=1043627 RepID=A0A0F7ZVF1_9HYPO|nr:hypothetical protein HIM_04232 [Hirsutella minnesotensis 3608]
MIPNALETQPLITLLSRQEPKQHAITQTLTRPETTLTTVVVLGSATASFPTETPSNTNQVPGSGSGLSSLQLGAILGSVAALVVILIAAGICHAQRRPNRPVVEYDYYSSYGTSSFSDDLPNHKQPKKPRYPPRMAEVIPGGAPFPTYRAVPIKNPRQTQKLKRTYV